MFMSGEQLQNRKEEAVMLERDIRQWTPEKSLKKPVTLIEHLVEIRMGVQRFEPDASRIQF
jgi:hypothetical protein